MLIATVLANDPNLIEENEVIEIPIEVEEIDDTEVEQDEAQDRFVDLSVDVSYGLPQLGEWAKYFDKFSQGFLKNLLFQGMCTMACICEVLVLHVEKVAERNLATTFAIRDLHRPKQPMATVSSQISTLNRISIPSRNH